MSKTVLIFHPMETDQDIKQVLIICEAIMRKSFCKNVVPAIPTLLYRPSTKLNFTNLALNSRLDNLYCQGEMVDELWLYGSRFTSDMFLATTWAESFKIPILYKNRLLADVHTSMVEKNTL